MVGDAFPRGTATAMGFVITFGWVGLAVSSRIIGALGWSDPKQLPTALLVVIMLVPRGMTPKKA